MKRIARFFYRNSIDGFLSDDYATIMHQLTEGHLGCIFSLEATQNAAWQEEIRILKSVLLPYKDRGSVFFEYNIPRMGKRIDAVVLIDGIVFLLEFKIFEGSYNKCDIAQLWDYALDLQNFHEESQTRPIIPVLVATEGKLITNDYHFWRPGLFNPLLCSKTSLPNVIDTVLFKVNYSDGHSDDDWAVSRYSPTPTIVEAASALYRNHSVADITRTDAAAENLEATTNYVKQVIQHSRQGKEKAICFVTGVPGAGKTLVGLNIATSSHTDNDALAVYLSGNFPLVQVLSEALARDKVAQSKQEGNRLTKAKAESEVKQFIQMIHHYRDTYLEGTKIENGEILKDEEYFKNVANKNYCPVDHVAIFDEAQRAWTQNELASFMARKKNVRDFPWSEPEYLISCLDRHEDWAVIVCLVGGGQEINRGEAGISEWIDSLNRRFPHWKIYVSDRLTESEYAAGSALEKAKSHQNVVLESKLHLAVSMRSFRAENLANFVHHLLDRNISEAQTSLKQLTNYPLALTRDINTAKQWLRAKARGSERYGIVASSAGDRLRPENVVVRMKPNVVHWFLDSNEDVRSSLYLEDVASEFDVQGLELDYTCVAWDADFRYDNGEWSYYEFSGGTKWNHIRNDGRKLYRKNAYRVLLTRARQGMIIFIPKGDENDSTRLPAFYDATYNYLRTIGIPEIGTREKKNEE